MFDHIARMVVEYRYRATCSCGWDSRWYLDPNVADEAAENHSTPLRHYATVEHKEA
jgi:hypothetical protein